MTHNESTRNFNYGPIVEADVGKNFNITISAAAFDPMSGTTKTSFMWFIVGTTKKQACSSSSLVDDRVIHDMSQKVNLPKVS